MRVAIYGTGGAGGYFGAQLARSGEDVTFIARGQHLKAIQRMAYASKCQLVRSYIQPAKANYHSLLPQKSRARGNVVFPQ